MVGRREGRRDGGMEGGRERGRDGGMEGGRKRGREGKMEEKKEGGRERLMEGENSSQQKESLFMMKSWFCRKHQAPANSSLVKAAQFYPILFYLRSLVPGGNHDPWSCSCYHFIWHGIRE